MLTKQQAELLSYVYGYLRANGGVAPTFKEMKHRMGFHSTASVARLITALEDRGFIRRIARHARAIEVLKMPDGLGGASVVADERARCADIVMQLVEPGHLRALLLKMIREGSSVAAGRAVV